MTPKPSTLTWQMNADTLPTRRRCELIGELNRYSVPNAFAPLSALLMEDNSSLILNLSRVKHLDSAGVAFLVALWRTGKQNKRDVIIEDASGDIRQALELYSTQRESMEPMAKVSPFESLGERTYESLRTTFHFLVLAADTSVEALISLVAPRRVRWPLLLEQCVHAGSRAVGIVGLISFLVGLTLAFQSAYQLRQFGAAIYVASLTAISMVREMGPLITAILVAGRSGASITSEVATMKVNEEVDAMQVMGIAFHQYISVPRLLALVFMVPLLTVMADVLGIFGGYLVASLYLDLASGAYLRETIQALGPKDLVTGLVKSIAFAWGICLLALFHGLRVEGGAQEVGRATTTSVVSAIFFIIVADSLFSIVFYVLL